MQLFRPHQPRSRLSNSKRAHPEREKCTHTYTPAQTVIDKETTHTHTHTRTYLQVDNGAKLSEKFVQLVNLEQLRGDVDDGDGGGGRSRAAWPRHRRTAGRGAARAMRRGGFSWPSVVGRRVAASVVRRVTRGPRRGTAPAGTIRPSACRTPTTRRRPWAPHAHAHAHAAVVPSRHHCCAPRLPG
jgi:hypothetical protein